MNILLIAALAVLSPDGAKVCEVTPPEIAGATLETKTLDGGVAWRLKFAGSGERTIENEEWIFDFGDDLRCWPVAHAQGEYIPKTISTIASMKPMPGHAPVAAGIGKMFNYAREIPGSAESPLTVEGPCWTAVVGDAGVLDYSRIRFMSGEKTGTVKTILEGPSKVTLPYATPWRYIHAEATPAALAEKQPAFLAELNEPSRIGDAGWVKPGRVIRVAKLTDESARATVDFAKRFGLEYVELDAGWYGQEHTGDPLKPGLAPEKIARGEHLDVPAVIDYANSLGVGVILYVNREPLKRNGDAGRDAILDQLVKWGVKGVKYGFVNVGDQKWRKWVVAAIEAAAKRRLVVDIHDEFRLTGIEKTYPNVLTVEGIHGNEEMPNAAHDCALPFTRFLDGPGDYTPCYKTARVKNSLAHQLALPVVYNSGLQFLFWYSRPEQIPESDPALEFWRELPASFDETRFLAGAIGEYAVSARRRGAKWFVGGINAKARRTLEVKLDFLGEGEYLLKLYRDADARATNGCAKALSEAPRRVKKGETLAVDCAANGGFAATLEPLPKDRVDAFLAEGEDALADRLCMYWDSHATDVFVRNEGVESVGGHADIPTVMFSGNRSHPTQMKRPRIEDIPRRNEDYLKPWHKSGTMIESINQEVLGLARTAAERWAAKGDERYARLAYRTLDTYLKGILARNVATDLNHGHQQTLFGLQSMETIHDNVLKSLCPLYETLKPYIAAHNPEKLVRFQNAFRKWAEVQIANGVADNNWDMMQLNFILDIALVLESDGKYADGKGREHYIDVVLNQDSVRNLSVKSLAAKGFDPETGVWWECPGYSLVTLKDFSAFADKVKDKLGMDLLEEIPVLRKAFAAAGEYLYPDGMVMGFGDTHPGALPKEVTKWAAPETKPFFYAPNASWLVSRSGMDPKSDIAFGLNASLGNHQHANGINLELFANNCRFAPEAGIGWQLYSGDDYKEYFSRFPAHNTVMVNSRSNYGAMKAYHPFELVSRTEDRVTVRFREPATGAGQERTVIRVGKDYFVDVFRSRLPASDGDRPQWHDYYLHLLGENMRFFASSTGTVPGKEGTVPEKPTERIAFVESGLYALSYLKEKYETTGTDPSGVEVANPRFGMTTRVFFNNCEGRSYIRALAPATEGLSRVKKPDYGITRDSRTPCLVLRQDGEAWTKPFVTVIDPKDLVKNVVFGENEISVARNDGKTDTISIK